MTFSDQYELRDRAETALDDGSHVVAADYYVAASHGWLMKKWWASDGDDHTPSAKTVGNWARDLFAGVLCYRIAGKNTRANNHGRYGLTLTDDLLTSGELTQTRNSEPRTALVHEIRGDFRLASQIGEPREEYDDAKKVYESIDSGDRQTHLAWQAEPEFIATISILLDIADGVGYEINDDLRERIQTTSLTDRIEYKREHYPAIVERALENGGW